MAKTPEELVDNLYACYGSDTGYLFGIPPDLKPAVEAIVKLISRWVDPEGKE